MFTTVAQRPNLPATCVISSGFLTAAEFRLTFSAPAWISRAASSSVRIPPRTGGLSASRPRGYGRPVGRNPEHVSDPLAQVLPLAPVRIDIAPAVVECGDRQTGQVASEQVEHVDSLPYPGAQN